MKTARAELYTTSNIVCNFEFSTCNTVGLFLWTTIIQYNLQVQGEIIPQPKLHNFICTQTLCINFRAVRAKL